MEHVFPTEINVSSSSADLNRGKASSAFAGVKEGVVEKIVEPGSFIVTLPDGMKVRVRGSESLKPGSRVQVQFAPVRLKGAERLPGITKPVQPDENGFEWSALIPLGFGGKDAKARLEVFVERQQESAWDKVVPAVYFVFVVHTKEMGEIQWSIHMKGRHVSLQVFAPEAQGFPGVLKTLVLEVEKGLKKKGFTILSPTVYLNRPFKVPSGFRLNVRG
jgi:hypothetical protein